MKEIDHKDNMDNQNQKDTVGARSFYKDAMEHLNSTGHRFMIGGAFALFQHTGIYRDTKDLDIFCISAECPDILYQLEQKGYKSEIRDSRWLAKAYKNEYFIDIIYSSPNGMCVVDKTWFEYAHQGEMEGVPSLFLPAEELLWCKIYVQNKERYDGADVNHIILKKGKELDWERVLHRLNHHWHLLLAQIFNFFFVYPGSKDCVPEWLFEELMTRARKDYNLPQSVEKVCRGPLLAHTQYDKDILEWNFKNS